MRREKGELSKQSEQHKQKQPKQSLLNNHHPETCKYCMWLEQLGNRVMSVVDCVCTLILASNEEMQEKQGFAISIILYN